jgi:uncharacterized membrane protein YphA (DoxX/SURF4 family)
VGTALALALVIAQGDLTGHRWADAVIGVAALLTLVPATTRVASAVMAGVMALLGVFGLATGQDALQQPVRALMFTILYGALAFDSVLLLRLGTGLSLFAFFGTTKIGWVVNGTTSNFAQLIRAVGFPLPRVLTVFAILNETVTPLLVTLGIWTRPAAIIGALGMTGAFYTSLRLGEDAGRAATYVVAFTSIAVLAGTTRTRD